jgi:hypothetical protein
MPAHAFGFATRQSFNIFALASGKKRAVGQIEEHRTRPLEDPHRDSVGKFARWWTRSARTFYLKSQPAALYRLAATRSEPDAQFATVFRHLAATSVSRLYPTVSTGIFPAFDHAYVISYERQMTNPITFG